MDFLVVLKPQAEKDFKSLPRDDARRVWQRLQRLSKGLHGDVKKLANFTPSYRLRVGDWRALFEIEGSQLVVYRVLHRREAYC